jgi:creatinine amidohydrolase
MIAKPVPGATMKKKHIIAHMTFREFAEVVPDNPVILLPLGSQEEHGPGSPMGDFLLTEALVGRVAEKSGALAAPTTPFGYADYFRPIPGGIQLQAQTFCMMLRDFADNFLNHGLTRLVIFNGHSGNYPVIDQTIRLIKQSTGVMIPCINVWRLMTPEKLKEIYGDKAGEASGHGADPLTSVYMHFYPEKLRMDLVDSTAKKKVWGLPTSALNAVRFQNVDVNIPLDVDEITDSGIVNGNPRVASAEIGAKIVEYIVDFTTAFLQHFDRETSSGTSGGTKETSR